MQIWILSFKSQADLPSGTWKMNHVWDALVIGVIMLGFFLADGQSQTEIS